MFEMRSRANLNLFWSSFGGIADNRTLKHPTASYNINQIQVADELRFNESKCKSSTTLSNRTSFCSKASQATMLSNEAYKIFTSFSGVAEFSVDIKAGGFGCQNKYCGDECGSDFTKELKVTVSLNSRSAR